jgi:hypothetical protein
MSNIIIDGITYKVNSSNTTNYEKTTKYQKYSSLDKRIFRVLDVLEYVLSVVSECECCREKVTLPHHDNLLVFASGDRRDGVVLEK